MTSVTYYVALPFVSTEVGELVASEAQECQTATAAIRWAQSLASSHAGAIAFARTGDPATADFDYAEVLQRFGKVPSDDVLMGYD